MFSFLREIRPEPGGIITRQGNDGPCTGDSTTESESRNQIF